MKVLVATHADQGEQDGDYCWTLDGELVSPLVLECANGDWCGCRRGFPGFASSRATTTAIVTELDHFGEAELVTAVTDYLTNAGWLTWLGEQDRQAQVANLIEAIMEVTSAFSVGTIVRRDGDFVYAPQRRAA